MSMIAVCPKSWEDVSSVLWDLWNYTHNYSSENTCSSEEQEILDKFEFKIEELDLVLDELRSFEEKRNEEKGHEKLNPCPFCGSTKVELTSNPIEAPFWWSASILCECSAQMIASGDTKWEAINNVVKLWNTRS